MSSRLTVTIDFACSADELRRRVADEINATRSPDDDELIEADDIDPLDAIMIVFGTDHLSDIDYDIEDGDIEDLHDRTV